MSKPRDLDRSGLHDRESGGPGLFMRMLSSSPEMHSTQPVQPLRNPLLTGTGDMTDPNSCLVPANALRIKPYALAHQDEKENNKIHASLKPLLTLQRTHLTPPQLLSLLGNYVIFEEDSLGYQDWLSLRAQRFIRFAVRDMPSLPILLNVHDPRSARIVLAMCPQILQPVQSATGWEIRFSAEELGALMLRIDRILAQFLSQRKFAPGGADMLDVAAQQSSLFHSAIGYCHKVLDELHSPAISLTAQTRDYDRCVHAHANWLRSQVGA